MSDNNQDAGHRHGPWTSRAASLFSALEGVVLTLIGVALVLVAVLLLYSSMYELNGAVRQGPLEIENRAIEILNTVLLVMMTMEIVYTVGITLKSHTLEAEPFLIAKLRHRTPNWLRVAATFLAGLTPPGAL